jgi:ABC-2 type transport system permease protein
VTATTGTWRLVRLALRRDRVVLPAWVVSIAALAAAVVASIGGLYADEAERTAVATFSAASTVARVFDGPASGTTLGAMAVTEAMLLLLLLTALMSSQAVVRHTRLEEETGRAELIGSAVVGHHARLAAALLVAVLANLGVLVAVTLAMAANGLAPAGSVATGAAVGGLGLVLAGVAAVTAQVFTTSRAANGAAGAALGVMFLLRAVGDAAGEIAESRVEVVSAWPSWLSPFGWSQQVRPFHQDNWEVLALHLALAAALVVVAFVLTGRRDLGAGLRAARPGPADAASWLRSPLGLAWRTQRAPIVGWAVGLGAGGAAFGAVGESAEEIMELSEQFADALRAAAPDGGLTELYFGFVVGFLGIAAAGFTVQALLRARTEEAAGRLEPVLAAAVSRRRWLGSQVAVAFGGTAVLLAVTGLVAVLGYGAASGDWGGGVRGLLGGSLAQVPATFALGGLVVAAVGLVPRAATAIGWTALALGLLMGQLGALLELPRSVLNLSPFTHVPPVGSGFEVLPLVVLTLVGAALAGVGAWAFTRRDLVTAA